MRDAATLVYEHGGTLGIEQQGDLLARLNTSPGARTTRAIRAVLNADVIPESKIADVKRIIDDASIQPATPPPDLPAINQDDIRLVAWMAVDAPPPEPL